MVDQIMKSTPDIFNNSTIDDSAGIEPLSSLDQSSGQSDIMGTNINSDLMSVTESLQGLLQESGSETGENTVNLDSDLMTGDSGNADPIIRFNQENLVTSTDTGQGSFNNSDHLYEGVYSAEYQLTGVQNDEIGEYVLGTTSVELSQTLVFSDTETGVLDNSDQTHQGRYRDEYILKGIEDQQTVTLNLDGMGFDSSLQLVNRETGEVIHQSQMTATEGMSQSQLTFTNNNNIEYLVRVTSTVENTTGSYTLGTTLGELSLGISDQTIQGSITESDGIVDVWTRSNSDVYEITQFSHFQTIDITLESLHQTTFLLLFNVDTGEKITSSIGYADSSDGVFRANLNYTPLRDTGINYGLVASFFSEGFGDYTLTLDTGFSLSGGFNSNHETIHPIIKSRFMDNFLLTDLQVGQDVELNLNSSSSSNIVQLFDQETGTVFESTRESELVFTVEEGINYGVRILGEAGDTYDLNTNTGILFDSNPTQLNQTITNSLSNSDALAYFKNFRSTTHSFYSDGYYLSGDSLSGKDQVTVTIENLDFLPEFHIINAQTGDILESYNLYNFDSHSMSYDLQVEQGMDYLVLVSSRYRQEVGEYTFSVNG